MKVSTRIVLALLAAAVGVLSPRPGTTGGAGPIFPWLSTARSVRFQNEAPRAGSFRKTEPSRRFSFETQEGEVNAALKAVLDARRSSPESAEAFAKMRQEADAAEAVLRKNPAQAAHTLVQELSGVAADDVDAYASLLGLLRIVGKEPEAIAFLLKCVNGLPSSAPAGHYADPESLIRYLAVTVLYRAAREGSAAASEALLQTVQSPNHLAKVTAIQDYYVLGKSRPRAKAAMKRLMDPKDYYLLYRY